MPDATVSPTPLPSGPRIELVSAIDIRVPTITILGASFATGNHGVSALASGTISAILEAVPNARIQILDYARVAEEYNIVTANGSVRVTLVNLRFSKRLFLHNNIALLICLAAGIRLIPIRSLRAALIQRNDLLRNIAMATLNLSLNGGDSFSDIYGFSRLVYVALPQILVLLLKRPLILLPQTYGPFKSRSARMLARFILRRSKCNYSRDKEGLEIVAKLLGRDHANARFAFDMGFALEPSPPGNEIQKMIRTLKAKGPLVGFNPSGLLMASASQDQNVFRLKTDYSELIRQILRLLLENNPNANILLIAHVYGSHESGESDATACKEIVTAFNKIGEHRVHFFSPYFDHNQTKYLIGQCDFFLGSRMHACIAALSQCVPAVGLAYSRKFLGVMEFLGEGACVVDLRDTSIPDTLSLVVDAWNRRTSMRASLMMSIPNLRRSVLSLCKEPAIQRLLTQKYP